MASEHALDVVVRRHVLASDRPFDEVLAGIFSGISQPDIAQLFSKLETSSTYQQFSSLVEQAQGRAGLMRFWQLGLDNALTLDPEAPDWTGRRLVRLIAGNPVTMGQMTRHVADAGSYAPVTILIEETPDGGTRVAYDSVVSALAPYDNAPPRRSPSGSMPRCLGFCARRPESRPGEGRDSGAWDQPSAAAAACLIRSATTCG